MAKYTQSFGAHIFVYVYTQIGGIIEPPEIAI